jgi:hypothetical protein
VKRTAELLLVAVASVAIAYGVGSCVSRVDASELAEREARARENGYRAAVAAYQNRRAKVDTITRTVIKYGTRIDTVVNIVDTVLATDTANMATLRATLSLLRTEVVTYRVTVDSLLVAHRAYNVATDHALVMADSTIGALKDVVAAERKKRWRYRGEGLVGGIVTAALLVLLL